MPDQQTYEMSPQRENIRRLSPLLFSSTDVQAWISEWDRETQSMSHTRWTRAATLQKILEVSSSSSVKKRLRISLCKPSSLAPIRIDEGTFWCLVNDFHLSTAFLDLVIGFRSRADLFSERAHGLWTTRLDVRSHSLTLCYSFGIVEPRDPAGSDTWAERQIGVYDRCCWASELEGITVLFHVGEGAKAYKNLTTNQEHDEWCNPLKLHVSLFSLHLGSWRWYLDTKRVKCVRWENEVLTADLADLTDSGLSFERLQDVRNEETYLLSAATTLESTLDILVNMLDIANRLGDLPEQRTNKITMHSLPPGYKSQQANIDKRPLSFSTDVETEKRAISDLICATKGYIASLRLIQARFEHLTKLLADGINHRGQLNATNVSSSLLDLQEKANEDNFSVRAITLITLIYLPTQLVSGLFGTNFINYQEQERKIEISRDFWIFIAMAVPLTLLTIALWLLTLIRRKRTRGGSKSDPEYAAAKDTLNLQGRNYRDKDHPGPRIGHKIAVKLKLLGRGRLFSR